MADEIISRSLVECLGVIDRAVERKIEKLAFTHRGKPPPKDKNANYTLIWGFYETFLFLLLRKV
jgi:hypothetical protein